jgi:hypothetical protein
MNIQHQSLFDIAQLEEHYSNKDGVPVKYVCTSDLRVSDIPMDIFYRETPHPEFGNYYFGVYKHPVTKDIFITNADEIESLEFGMIEHEGKYYYSQSHHDYKSIGGKMIDGGRAYIKSSGGAVTMHIKNGKFYINNIQDLIRSKDHG